MARGLTILHVRIPFFRIFYSTTYTTLYFITICFLLITPVSMMWQASTQLALQYDVMIGGTVVLTASIAIFIFASRLYTNRTVMAGVGKPYVPVEQGEVGRSVRKMIVQQLERSAMVAWESRPRDLFGEILQAEQHGVLPPQSLGLVRNGYTVGREIPIDPASPPWGEVQNLGWSSPTHKNDNDVPHLQFAPVIEELPNLVEARAVSLAPPDPSGITMDGARQADPSVFEVLRRPETMGMRDYLTQLSYLGLVNPLEAGQKFLSQYENARFSGLPVSETEFKSLMAAFADLLSGMTDLQPAVINEIRLQAADKASIEDANDQYARPTPETRRTDSYSSPRSPKSSVGSPVTARTGPSRDVTPYLQQDGSEESVISVRDRALPENDDLPLGMRSGLTTRDSSSLESVESVESPESDSGSVLRHTYSSND